MHISAANCNRSRSAQRKVLSGTGKARWYHGEQSPSVLSIDFTVCRSESGPKGILGAFGNDRKYMVLCVRGRWAAEILGRNKDMAHATVYFMVSLSLTHKKKKRVVDC
jgi:hypothetical protein